MQWFTSDAGDTKGPMSAADVRREIDAGRLRAGMHVRDEGGKWVPVEQSPFAGRFSAIDEAPAKKNSILPNIISAVVVLGLVVYCNKRSESAEGQSSSTPTVMGGSFDSMQECLQSIRSKTGLELRPVTDEPDKVSGYLGTTDRDFACTKESTGTRGIQWKGWYEE
jgi:hypothetical protein